MKFTGLQSAALPDTSDSIKECVNLGQWMLFKSNAEMVGVYFFLKTTSEIYALDERGGILSHMHVSDTVEMSEIFYFSDLPQPDSLSNVSLSIIE